MFSRCGIVSAISGIEEGSFQCSPLAEIGVGARSFAEGLVGPPCAAGVARSCGLGGSAGAPESRSKTGHSKTDSNVKLQSDTTTFISVLYIIYKYVITNGMHLVQKMRWKAL